MCTYYLCAYVCACVCVFVGACVQESGHNE